MGEEYRDTVLEFAVPSGVKSPPWGASKSSGVCNKTETKTQVGRPLTRRRGKLLLTASAIWDVCTMVGGLWALQNKCRRALGLCAEASASLFLRFC